MEKPIIRVFPRRTKLTPTDGYAFVGEPPFETWRPYADEVHISVPFTWDIEEGKRLQESWRRFYPVVKLGGPAIGLTRGDWFEPGLYIKQGVTITSRGCNNQCPWCLVPQREGRITPIPIHPGHIHQDNNLLQCPRNHIEEVFAMLRSQRRGVTLAGGLQSNLLKDWIIEEIRSISIKELFLAADTKEALRPLENAVKKLSFLRTEKEIKDGKPAQKIRCYVMIGYEGESLPEAEDRLKRVWEIGCIPFSQLYQPEDPYIKYPREWTWLNRNWSRPAITKIINDN